MGQTIWIDAPVSLVWALTQEVEHRTQWDRRISFIKILTPEPRGRGSRVAYRARLMGLLPIAWEAEYIGYRLDHVTAIRLVKASLLSPMRAARGGWTYKPTGGGTVFATRFTYQAAYGPLGAWMDRAVGERYANLKTRRALKRLKALAEAMAAAEHRYTKGEYRGR